MATIWYQDDYEGSVRTRVSFSNDICVSKRVSSTGCPGSANNRVSSSVLLYSTGWLQSNIRMILRVRFVRVCPISNDICVSKRVSSTGCPGSVNNRVSGSVLLYRVATILYQDNFEGSVCTRVSSF